MTSSLTDITDEYRFYNRSEQDKTNYFDFQYTVFHNGLCGQLDIPPLKRICTPFLHVHPHQTEQFFLQQGQLSYQLKDKVYTCDIHTCPSPIVILPSTPHTFWMGDNKEDLIFIVRTEPLYKDHGLRPSSYENIAGARRDHSMNIWQVFVFVHNIETYPVLLPLSLTTWIFRIGSIFGHLLGYQIEYEEYTTRMWND